MARFRSRIGTIIGAGLIILIALIAFALTVTRTTIPGTPTPPPTGTPYREAQIAFTAGECIKITHPTDLRLGPGENYPPYTNIPIRAQPHMTIIEGPKAGLVCPNNADGQPCNPHNEGWWWPVQAEWSDNGDVDRGWLWQDDIRPCA